MMGGALNFASLLFGLVDECANSILEICVASFRVHNQVIQPLLDKFD
jgi:hypothetical protein